MASTTYFGITVEPLGTVTGNAATARASFEAALDPLDSEGFTAQTLGTHATLSLFGGEGTMVADYDHFPTEERVPAEIVDASSDAPEFGRFGTTGSDPERWLLTGVSIEVSFSPFRNGVGLFLTDIGDYLSVMEVEFVHSDDVTETVSLNGQDVGVGAPNNGWLVFVGIIDPDVTFKAVRFNIQQPSADPNEWDYIGLDDFVLGDVPAAPPPPPPPPAGQALSVTRGWGKNYDVLTVRMVPSPAPSPE